MALFAERSRYEHVSLDADGIAVGSHPPYVTVPIVLNLLDGLAALHARGVTYPAGGRAAGDGGRGSQARFSSPGPCR